MNLILFLLLFSGAWCDVKVSVDEKGGYNITINNKVWLRSGRTAIYADDRWYSTEDNTLPLVSITTAQGTDPLLDAWNETQLTFNLVRRQGSASVTARIRQWTIASAFTFHLDVGNQDLTNQISLDYNEVRTVFPSFYIEQIDSSDARGYFTVGGFMGGYGDKHAGSWTSSSQVITSGMESGPIVVFDPADKGEGDLLVLSPFSHFMATSFSQRNNLLEYGVIGSMSFVPANYSQGMIVFYSESGLNEGVHTWGQLMQQAYNRTNVNRLNDVTVNYLGYYTDNGGYYYYNTEPGMNYQTTMVDAINKIALPFRYLQLDSWWYYKGLGDGVSQWTARPDIFPDGLPALNRRLESMPFAAHNRYWAYDNTYKNKYAFELDIGNGKALPVGNDSFWIDLFTDARNWGLVLYEQDWLNIQTERCRPLWKNIYLGEQWLTSMGSAAEQVGLNIQYCMSLPRHILQSLLVPRVTHARASDDYATHLKDPNKSTWDIGVTSLFLDAVGVAPFKDVFWSTAEQPMSPYGSSAKEIFPDREILIATMSTGPVGPGDGINYVNATKIMRCCRMDGLILKPDRPLRTINALLSDWATYGQTQGELYSTETNINDRMFYTVFASAMKRDYSVYPSMIGADSGFIWSYENASNVVIFDDTHPLEVASSKCNDLTICLWYVSPIWQFNDPARTKYALLGEMNKWTAVSQQRFVSISTNAQKTQAVIILQGANSEQVSIAIYHSSLRTVIVSCSLSKTTGQASITITPTNVSCM